MAWGPNGAWSVLCILLVSLCLAGASDSFHIFGTVRAGNDEAVAHNEVRIDGAGAQITTDSGGFRFPLQPPLKIGFAATFHVKGWVITDPFVLVRGRTYLPSPDAEPIAIRVLRPGDPKLLSASNLAHVVEEQAARFKSKRVSDEIQGASSQHWRPLGAVDLPTIQAQEWTESTSSSLMLSEAAYSLDSVRSVSPLLSLAQQPKAYLESDSFLATQATDLGLTVDDLKVALDQWSKSATSSYQKGLAALYKQQYAQASQYISEFLSSAPSGFLERYVPLARAEYEQGHYAIAEAALRKVLAVHPDDPLILNNLAVVLLAEARYSEAEPLFTRAISINEITLGADHPLLIIQLSNLAALFEAQGKYTQAESLYRRALAIDEKVLESGYHPEVGNLFNNLAGLYEKQSKYAEAEMLYRRALIIFEKTLGQEHSSVAICLSNLASLDWRLGKYAEAETLIKRSLAIDENAFGSDHPHVATRLSILGLIYKSQGKYLEAETLYKRSLSIDEKVFGWEHPAVAIRLNNLALLYRVEGKYAEAEPLYKRALAINEKTFGSEHPEVARNLNNLGLLYRIQGKYLQAEPLYRRALAIDEKALGTLHPEVGTIARNLAVLLRRLGRNEEAKVYEKQAARIRAGNKQRQ